MRTNFAFFFRVFPCVSWTQFRMLQLSDATRHSPSLRAQHTAGPLAQALDLTIHHAFADGEEEGLVAAALAARVHLPLVGYCVNASLRPGQLS